LIMLTDCTTLP